MACQAPAPAGLTQADMDAIRAVSDSFLVHFKAKNWDALSGLYTEDAAILPPNEPAVRGRAAIREWMAAFPAAETLAFSNMRIDGRGDLAYVQADYAMKLEGMPADTGKFIEIRQRDPDGVWRLKYDMFSSNVPVTVPELVVQQQPGRR
ncbi:MAG: nuclear transport factor 2 family protein [Gemmatimonadetes bacterium]|nr:nuclear transport factor 2 family protein [Gemmatimonadota bacterium]